MSKIIIKKDGKKIATYKGSCMVNELNAIVHSMTDENGKTGIPPKTSICEKLYGKGTFAVRVS